MIISASYRTDIPAFYGKWFMNRLKAGFCKVINPYSGKFYLVDLKLNSVDCFIFWTKNIGPFLENLKIINSIGFPFIIQYSVNNYPSFLEKSVVNLERSLNHIREICEVYGKRTVVWRYDPIITNTINDYDWHVSNFSKISEALKGYVDEVVTSFLHPYQKTVKNMLKAEAQFKFRTMNPTFLEKVTLLNSLKILASKNNIKLTVCSHPELTVANIDAASCIDLSRIQDVVGHPIRAIIKGNRLGCYCAESRDIGAYDTCPHGCIYCYAVKNPQIATKAIERHDPYSEYLTP